VKPYYDEDGITIYHGDCYDLLPTIPPESVGLVITDPPYGIDYEGVRRDNGWTGAQPTGLGPVLGDGKTMDLSPVFRFGRLVVFGANYFPEQIHPGPSGWIVWDKRGDGRSAGRDMTISDCELVWTWGLGFLRVIRFSHMWHGVARWANEPIVHPTQKPLSLMRWILDGWTEPGDLILDPFMGSGPVAQACRELGRRYVGVEIEERYCEIAVQRLAQGVLEFG